MRVGAGGDTKVGEGWTKFEEEVVDNIGGVLHKIGGLALICQLSKEALKISHPSHYKTNLPHF